MIRLFEIDNFKSLVNFSLPMPPHVLGRFVCLIGLNGAGKSTVLQALDFLGHVGTGNVIEWLKIRDWEAADLTSRFLKKQLINFRLEFEFDGLDTVVWEGAFNSVLKRCTSESIAVNGEFVLFATNQKLTARLRPSGSLQDNAPVSQHLDLQNLSYQGSTLSLLKTGRWHDAIDAVRERLASLKSLDMLSPQAMRQRSRDGVDIGYGGERLSAYIHGMDALGKQQLLALLQEFYPSVDGLTTRAVRAGWKELSVGERYLDASEKPLYTSAKQLNDGLLRILAILAQVEIGRVAEVPHLSSQTGTRVPRGCVLFDEIENGVNPELMKKLVEKLIQAPQQVMVTTHSPLILNYLPIEVAEESVILLYRDRNGHTKSVRFFDLPETHRKLGLLGPGEVFVDTDLTRFPAQVEDWMQKMTDTLTGKAPKAASQTVEPSPDPDRLDRTAIRAARRAVRKQSDGADE